MLARILIFYWSIQYLSLLFVMLKAKQVKDELCEMVDRTSTMGTDNSTIGQDTTTDYGSEEDEVSSHPQPKCCCLRRRTHSKNKRKTSQEERSLEH